MKAYLITFAAFLIIILGLIFQVNKSIKQVADIDLATFDSGTQKPEPEKDTLLETIDSILLAPKQDSFDLKIIDGYTELNWKFLARIEFNEVFNEEMDAYIPYPVFHDDIKALDGKKVIIRGYVIPVDETGNEQILVLSAFPYANCFFCGNAGPESVMDVKTKKKQKAFKIDQSHTFKGKLKLNDKDLYYLNYILEDAELMLAD